MQRVVIVGGGITGLTLAWTLRQRTFADPLQITVLERGTRAGGAVRTDVVDGYLCEHGPGGFLDNATTTLALVRDLGLEGRLVTSRDAARRRFVVRHGRLYRIPRSIGELLTTPLLSRRGRLRVILEPVAARRPEGDESIEAFAVRRIGREAAAAFIEPMAAGIFGGDARELSLRACLPRFWELETRYGGLLQAFAARRLAAAACSIAEAVSNRRRTRQRAPTIPGHSRGAAPPGPGRPSRSVTPGSPAGRLLSFAGGMGELVGALCDRLGETIRGGHRVVAIHPIPRPADPDAPPGPRYVVDVAEFGSIEADAVVLTGATEEAAAIVAGVDPALAGTLRRIPHVPLVVVCLGYCAETLAAAGVQLDGFGFLVPREEPLRVLGVVWESSIYPGRAPEGRVLLRAIVGGARDPGAVHLDEPVLVEAVRRDLARTMRLDGDPAFTRVVRHPQGLPQYTLGHFERLAAIEERLSHHPGLFLAGHAYRGMGVNACVGEARSLADRILAYLDARRSQGSPADPDTASDLRT
ncbi:MAG TPA: protoporphyrinogen oxidase [Vicinamibacterales bacterium]|nr:protoporphyrinogen oxidase [Vicinamibacterales bacterium]